MKVLFIASGRKSRVGEVVLNQGESLTQQGIDIDYFMIQPGIWGYISSIPRLRKAFKSGQYAIAHAHYSLSGYTAALAGCRPLIVSIMGSDAYASWIQRVLIRWFSFLFWDVTIAKSERIKDLLKIRSARVIPNGVDLERFIPAEKKSSRERLKLNPDGFIVLFIGDPGRNEKNYTLANEAVSQLGLKDAELKCLFGASNIKVPDYLNAADIMLLTSKWEGSANAVKEAMACNCPVVSTDVGDVSWLFGRTEGYFISEPEINALVRKLKEGIAFAKVKGLTNGRERLIELKLDSGSVASEIIMVYQEAIEKYAGNNRSGKD